MQHTSTRGGRNRLRRFHATSGLFGLQFGEFGLTSVEHETHEKYFYATEHWNYFSNDDDLGPVILR